MQSGQRRVWKSLPGIVTAAQVETARGRLCVCDSSCVGCVYCVPEDGVKARCDGELDVVISGTKSEGSWRRGPSWDGRKVHDSKGRTQQRRPRKLEAA